MSEEFQGTVEDWIKALEYSANIWAENPKPEENRESVMCQFVESLGIYTYCSDIDFVLAPKLRKVLRSVLDIERFKEEDMAEYLTLLHTPVLTKFATWGSSPYSAYFDAIHPNDEPSWFVQANQLVAPSYEPAYHFKLDTREKVTTYFTALLAFYDKYVKE